MNTRQLLEAVIHVDSTDVMAAVRRAVKGLVGKGLATEEIVDGLNLATVSYDVVFEPKYARNIRLNYDEVSSNIAGGGTADDGTIIVNYDTEHGLEEVFAEEGEQLRDFLTAVQNVVDHELVHREQLDRSNGQARGKDPHDTANYLAQPEESMAMAKQAANQFLQLGYTKQQVLNLLRAPWRKRDGVPDRGESDIFWTYTEYFDGQDPAWQRFARYMSDYLNTSGD